MPCRLTGVGKESALGVRHSKASTRLVPQEVLEGQGSQQLWVTLHGAPCSGLDMAGSGCQGTCWSGGALGLGGRGSAGLPVEQAGQSLAARAHPINSASSRAASRHWGSPRRRAPR